MEENKKYDVGIFGLWYGHNYGSIVTYYALTNVISAMGYSTVMIKNPLGSEIDVNTLRKSHALRFAAKHYDITPLYRISQMKKLNDICDKFLLGSDQMWHYGLSRPYQQSYFFDFADDDKIKVAYATSFGREKYEAPEDYKAEAQKNLNRFTAISVRDDFSKEICDKDFGIIAEQVIDPVFLCPVEKYEQLIEEADKKYLNNFFFAYILDPNPEWGKAICDLSEKTGKRAVVIFDEGCDKQKAIERLNVDDKNVEYFVEADVCEWLCCFKNSDFVVTDSFHGACFSMIFRKTFTVLKNSRRGGGRFDCLLDMAGLKSQMVTDVAQIESGFEELILNRKVNYSNVEKRLEEEKNRGYAWLKKALEAPKSKKNITDSLDKLMCTGCGACVSVCPVDALSLRSDDLGYYRSTVDPNKCIECGKCIKICPALFLPKKDNSIKPELFEFVASDENVLFNSSSGGAFPLLAAEAFKRGGVVAGAAWTDNLSVEHIIVDNEKDLHKLQKSKYLQSYLGDIFREIKKKLEQDIFVLFTGCPCQVTGLKSYLGRDFENLIVVDLLCGNSPSTMFFKKYLENDFPSMPIKYEFRNKEFGWDATCAAITLSTGEKIKRKGGRQDNYQRVYHNHTMCAPHCEKCKYQSLPRFGDLTIGDFWGIGKKESSLDTTKGVSAVLCNNEKGRKFFDSIPIESIAIKKKVPLSWLGGNGYAINNNHNFCSPKRNDFYKAIRTMNFTEAINYAVKPNHGVKEKTGLFDYRPKAVHFSFDPSVWCENYINGAIVLSTKISNPTAGNYAVLPIFSDIKAGKKYVFKARFKICTDSPIFNFHIKSAGEKYNQIIYSYKVEPTISTKWVEISKDFVADSDIYDEFMIGASQLQGENRWLAIDYIKIEDKE